MCCIPFLKPGYSCADYQLSPGMVFDEDIYTENKLLIVAKGQEITAALQLKLKSFHDRGALEDSIRVVLPRAHKAAHASASQLAGPQPAEGARG